MAEVTAEMVERGAQALFDDAIAGGADIVLTETMWAMFQHRARRVLDAGLATDDYLAAIGYDPDDVRDVNGDR